MTTAAFLPLIRQAGASNESAKVVNISATLGSTTLVQDSRLAPNKNIVYGMSKSALMYYTKVLAGDLKKSNVIAISVCPGWVKTDLGGSKAMLTVEQSVSAIVKLIDSMSKDQSGAFLDRMGKKIAF
uniref:C-factor n=1 Tax=Ditylenchus dipsaci TaxID=166011 RepID=A0A915D1S9_9BILA